MEGGVCPGCEFLSVTRKVCPICGKKLRSATDVIAEAMALAVKKNCRVIQMRRDFGLERIGHIGALLRYKR